MTHVPVLLHEVVEGLAIQKGDTVFDATVGDGGHARELCKRIGVSGKIIGFDLDENALEEAKKNLSGCLSKIILRKANFRNTEEKFKELGVSKINRALFDLGLRSEELEESGRGFSFKKDEPLLMTYDSNPPAGSLTAFEVVNVWPEKDIADVLKEYGDERFARRIARAIVDRRKTKPFTSSLELSAVIEKSIPLRFQRQRIHPSTRTFQAIRIAVNDEEAALREALEAVSGLLEPRGRIAVISFHSGEDRIVKHLFRDLADSEAYSRITKKPITPTEEEVAANPRARSAKLRIIQKQ